MNRMICLLLILAQLASCNRENVKPVILPDPVGESKKVVPLNLAPLPPLDLSAFKGLYTVEQFPEGMQACVRLDDVHLVGELYTVLGGRIREQQKMIEQYQNYYEKENTDTK